MFKRTLIVFSFLALLGNPVYATDAKDPYETFNRHAHAFNNKLDQVIFKPIAIFYKAFLPPPLMRGINNFFSNLEEIPNFINDILQLDGSWAGNDAGRFLINSTAGILGLVDVASQVGLAKHSQDFGLTLARWGYQNSAYLVLPLFGPSTVRDGIARPINYNFFTVYPWVDPKTVRYSMLGTYYVDARAQLLDLEEARRAAALDLYIFDRNAYLQHRAFILQQLKAGKKTTAENAADANQNDPYVE